MTTHDRVDELLAGFALGAVSTDEAKLVRDHIAGCAQCSSTQAELAETAAVLPLSIEEIEPPASLRERVLTAARQPAPKMVDSPGSGLVSLPRRWFRPAHMYPWAAAAALLVSLGYWNLTLQNQISHTRSQLAAEQHQVVRGNLADAHSASVGSFSYLSSDHITLVALHALSAPPSSRVYELWVIDSNGKADPAGVFLPEPDGTKLLVVSRPLARGDQLAVTVEAVAGSPQPTTTPILTGKL